MDTEARGGTVADTDKKEKTKRGGEKALSNANKIRTISAFMFIVIMYISTVGFVHVKEEQIYSLLNLKNIQTNMVNTRSGDEKGIFCGEAVISPNKLQSSNEEMLCQNSFFVQSIFLKMSIKQTFTYAKDYRIKLFDNVVLRE